MWWQSSELTITVKACPVVIRIMLLNEMYSDFAHVTRLEFPSFPWPNFIFYKSYLTSWKGPPMHNSKEYTSDVQNIDTRVNVEYHNVIWENS